MKITIALLSLTIASSAFAQAYGDGDPCHGVRQAYNGAAIDISEQVRALATIQRKNKAAIDDPKFISKVAALAEAIASDTSVVQANRKAYRECNE